MHIGVLLICCIAWLPVASAAPGVIAVARVDAYEAPSDASKVVAQLSRGVVICMLEAGDAAGVQSSPGWLAIRVQGGSGIGYVRSEAVAQATALGQDGDCERLSVAASAAASAPVRTSSAVGDVPRRPPPTASEPAPVAGTFLPLHPIRLAFGIASGFEAMQAELADQHHIASSGVIFNATFGLTIFDVLWVSTSAGFAVPSDHASFSEDVVPLGGGDVSSADSQLELHILSATIGLRTPFLVLAPATRGALAIAGFVGYGSSSISGSRTIANCSDCRTDHFDLKNGTFWRAGIDLSPPARSSKAAYAITAAYQRYEAGAGITGEFHLGLTLLLL